MLRLLAPGYALGLLAALAGWGAFAARRLGLEDERDPGLLACVGLVALVFAGGALNAAGLAYGAAVDAALAAGLWLAWREPALRRAVLPKGRERIPYALLLVFALALSLAVVPARAFNFVDDYRSYIARPLRMLAVGTLAGNPFDGLGYDSPGGHAFLQGLVLRHLPVSCLHLWDAVLGFVLAGLALLALARRLGADWRRSLAAVAVFIVIPPQQVNVTALYTGSALMLCAVLCGLELERRWNPRLAFLWGATLSALVMLKTTFAVYAAAYALLCLASIRRPLPAIWGAAAVALPWAAAYLRDYLSLDRSLSDPAAPGYALAALGARLRWLFSTESSFYGGVVLLFTLSALALGGGFARLRGRGSAAVSSALGAAFVAYFFAPVMISTASVVRYSCPMLIAAAPAAVLALERRFAAGLAALALVGFSPVLARRAAEAVREGSLLSFPATEPFRQYNGLVLSERGGEWVRGAQYAGLREGESALAALGAPFLLDFERNRILTMNDVGFMNPLVRFPLGAPPEAFRELLLRRGVEAIMWDKGGYGSPMRGDLSLLLNAPLPHYNRAGLKQLQALHWLRALSERSKPSYDDGRIVVFRLNN